MKKAKVADCYQDLQSKICLVLEKADGKGLFKTDSWTKPLGKGITKVLLNGDAIEKAAVNFSVVSGKLSPAMQKALDLKSEEEYYATGISSIIHPKNPHLPIIHMNVRYFQLNSGQAWFGGGIDLTPHYVNISEAKWFHQELNALCDKYEPQYYKDFKEQADDYFYLPHRGETRGIGGIFFDHQDASSIKKFDKLLNFTSDLAQAYPKIYASILNTNRNRAVSEGEKQWQNIRRGRYVEFNLLYDRGTKFGLESNGRTESILLSMPPMASWEYNFDVKEFSAEEMTLSFLKRGLNWIDMEEKECFKNE